MTNQKKNKILKGIKKATVVKQSNKKNLRKYSDNTLTKEDLNLLEKHQTLKLQIELIPTTCWGTNVRCNIKVSQWDNIRKTVYQRANNLCEICGDKGTKYPVECHEVWIYEEDTMTQ